MVKNPPVMQGTWIPFLGWKDPMEKEMAIHSSIFAWKSPWTEEPGGLQSIGLQRVGHNLMSKETKKEILLVNRNTVNFCIFLMSCSHAEFTDESNSFK